MAYTFKATVNYPEQNDVETSDFEANSVERLCDLVRKLLAEKDATSFVITIAKK